MPRREPQNIEAEISVLGCGFLEKDALDKIAEYLIEKETISGKEFMLPGACIRRSRRRRWNSGTARQGSARSRCWRCRRRGRRW